MNEKNVSYSEFLGEFKIFLSVDYEKEDHYFKTVYSTSDLYKTLDYLTKKGYEFIG